MSNGANAEFSAENFTQAINEYKRLFESSDEWTYKKEPYLIIAMYQAMGVRKVAKQLDTMNDKIDALNKNLETIAQNIEASGDAIAREVDEIRHI